MTIQIEKAEAEGVDNAEVAVEAAVIHCIILCNSFCVSHLT